MKKAYSQKWQKYFIKLRGNDPLLIPKDTLDKEKKCKPR